MNELLSIAIPTYNRSEQLDILLDEYCKLIVLYDIGIYISDNCSTDDTMHVVNKYKNKYPSNILYFRQEVNRGPDYNFEFILKKNCAKYVWLHSDDDCADVDEVGNVLLELASNNYDFMVLNAKGRVKDIASCVFTDKNALLEQIGWHMQFMSCLIFSAKMIKESDFTKFYNTYLLQYAIMFDYLSKKKNISVAWFSKEIVNSLKYVDREKKNRGWSDKTFFIFCKMWYEVNWNLPACYSIEAKMSAIIKHGSKSGLFSVKNLIILSLKGIFNPRIFWEYRKYINKTIPYNSMSLLLISCLPKIPKVVIEIRQKIINVWGA